MAAARASAMRHVANTLNQMVAILVKNVSNNCIEGMTNTPHEKIKNES